MRWLLLLPSSGHLWCPAGHQRLPWLLPFGEPPLDGKAAQPCFAVLFPQHPEGVQGKQGKESLSFSRSSKNFGLRETRIYDSPTKLVFSSKSNFVRFKSKLRQGVTSGGQPLCRQAVPLDGNLRCPAKADFAFSRLRTSLLLLWSN